MKKGREPGLQPLGRRVIVRPDAAKDQTASGIVVGQASEPFGTVEAIGPQVEAVSVGDRVLFSPFHYEELPGGLYVVDELDLWARLA